MPAKKMAIIRWDRLPCGICHWGCKPYFCRTKIPIKKHQQHDLLKTGCHAFKKAITETLSDKD